MTIFMFLATASWAVTVSGLEPDAGFQYSATEPGPGFVPGPASSAQPIAALPWALTSGTSWLMNDAYWS